MVQPDSELTHLLLTQLRDSFPASQSCSEHPWMELLMQGRVREANRTVPDKVSIAPELPSMFSWSALGLALLEEEVPEALIEELVTNYPPILDEEDVGVRSFLLDRALRTGNAKVFALIDQITRLIKNPNPNPKTVHIVGDRHRRQDSDSVLTQHNKILSIWAQQERLTPFDAFRVAVEEGKWDIVAYLRKRMPSESRFAHELFRVWRDRQATFPPYVYRVMLAKADNSRPEENLLSMLKEAVLRRDPDLIREALTGQSQSDAMRWWSTEYVWPRRELSQNYLEDMFEWLALLDCKDDHHAVWTYFLETFFPVLLQPEVQSHGLANSLVLRAYLRGREEFITVLKGFVHQYFVSKEDAEATEDCEWAADIRLWKRFPPDKKEIVMTTSWAEVGTIKMPDRLVQLLIAVYPEVLTERLSRFLNHHYITDLACAACSTDLVERILDMAPQFPLNRDSSLSQSYLNTGQRALPLVSAVRRANLPLIKLLLSRGARFECTNADLLRILTRIDAVPEMEENLFECAHFLLSREDFPQSQEQKLLEKAFSRCCYPVIQAVLGHDRKRALAPSAYEDFAYCCFKKTSGPWQAAALQKSLHLLLSHSPRLLNGPSDRRGRSIYQHMMNTPFTSVIHGLLDRMPPEHATILENGKTPLVCRIDYWSSTSRINEKQELAIFTRLLEIGGRHWNDQIDSLFLELTGQAFKDVHAVACAYLIENYREHLHISEDQCMEVLCSCAREVSSATRLGVMMGRYGLLSIEYLQSYDPVSEKNRELAQSLLQTVRKKSAISYPRPPTSLS